MRTLTWRQFGHNGPYSVDFVYTAVQFKVQDMWIGIYWRNESTIDRIDYSIWICFVPMLPIYIRRVRSL